MILATSYKRHEIYDPDTGLTPAQIRHLADGVDRLRAAQTATLYRAFASFAPIVVMGTALGMTGDAKVQGAYDDLTRALVRIADDLDAIALDAPAPPSAPGASATAVADRPARRPGDPPRGKSGLPPLPLFVANVPHLVNYELPAEIVPAPGWRVPERS